MDASRTKEELSATIETNKELRMALSSSTDQLTVLLALLLERSDQAKAVEMVLLLAVILMILIIGSIFMTFLAVSRLF